jgi:hypothetical protein
MIENQALSFYMEFARVAYSPDFVSYHMKLLKALRLEVKLIAYHYIRKALNLY